MRVGISLPAAVPDTDMTLLGRWAAEAEECGFESVGVIDRLIYDNVDPLTAMAAAAGCTSHVELLSGWPADYGASGVPLAGRGARFDEALSELGQAAPIMVGGTVPASFRRAASKPSDCWVAPLFGLDLLRDGARATRDAWEAAGREGAPRILTGRYFCLGPGADLTADAYIHHYYGAEFFAAARADTRDLAQVATLAGVPEGALA